MTDGIPNLRLANEGRVDLVRRFYEHAPFPGYPARDSLAWLRARAERSEFARLLNQAIPGDARILEIGCGTGQMSLYLARADRLVVGADLTRASLELAVAASRRFRLDRVLFVETDLHHPADRKSTRLNSSHVEISYAVFCLKKKKCRSTASAMKMICSMRARAE